MNIHCTCVEANNVFNLIDQRQPKPKSNFKPCINFDPMDIIKAVDGPLYILVKINGKFSQGVLVDPVYGECCNCRTSLYKTISP